MTSPTLEKAMVTKPVTLHLMPREDGGLRIKADELPGLILSNIDHAALFRDLPEVIRDLIAYGGYTPSLPSGGDVGEIAARQERDVHQQRLEKDGWFSWSIIQQMLKDRATLLAALTASEAERERMRGIIRRIIEHHAFPRCDCAADDCLTGIAIAAYEATP